MIHPGDVVKIREPHAPRGGFPTSSPTVPPQAPPPQEPTQSSQPRPSDASADAVPSDHHAIPLARKLFLSGDTADDVSRIKQLFSLTRDATTVGTTEYENFGPPKFTLSQEGSVDFGLTSLSFSLDSNGGYTVGSELHTPSAPIQAFVLGTRTNSAGVGVSGGIRGPNGMTLLAGGFNAGAGKVSVHQTVLDATVKLEVDFVARTVSLSGSAKGSAFQNVRADTTVKFTTSLATAAVAVGSATLVAGAPLVIPALARLAIVETATASGTAALVIPLAAAP